MSLDPEIETRLKVLEEVIALLVDMRDPAEVDFPIVTSDARGRWSNQAALRLRELRKSLPA